MPAGSNRRFTAMVAGLLAFLAMPAGAQAPDATSGEPTFADIADMADSAGAVVLVQIANQLPVEDARAPNLQPGYRRFYIEAKTKSLLTGSAPIGESVRYLVDLPLDSRGKAPKLKKR